MLQVLFIILIEQLIIKGKRNNLENLNIILLLIKIIEVKKRKNRKKNYLIIP